MLDTLTKMLDSEKTKKKGGKAKKQITMKSKGVTNDQEKNTKSLSVVLYRLMMTRHKLVQNHLKMNWLSDIIKKRE